jgi:hypothetical protein
MNTDENPGPLGQSPDAARKASDATESTYVATLANSLSSQQKAMFAATLLASVSIDKRDQALASGQSI